jgi:hypothetical protein
VPEVYDIGPIAVPRLTCREARRLGRRVVAARGSADPETLALAADARDMLVRANLAWPSTWARGGRPSGACPGTRWSPRPRSGW